MRSLCGKSINNIHGLYYFYCFNIFPNKRHGIKIRTLMVTKIFCIYRLNIWHNLLDKSRKRQVVMKMKVDSNKGICTDFGRNFLYGSKDDHDYLTLFYFPMNLLPFQLQELHCLSLVVLHLEFITRLIKSACTRPLLTKLDPLLFKNF